MQKHFFIRVEGKCRKINFSEIIYLEDCRDYIKIVTDDGFYLVLFCMERIEKFLPSNLFRRMHKSFIVSIDKIIGFDCNKVYLKKDKELPVGRQYKEELQRGVLMVNNTDCGFDVMDLSIYPISFVANENPGNRLF